MFDRRITYSIDLNTGMVYSRVGNEVAVPVPRWGELRMKGSFDSEYVLERFPAYAISIKWPSLHSTQKIPLEVQNYHRKFWSLPKLSSAI